MCGIPRCVPFGPAVETVVCKWAHGPTGSTDGRARGWRRVRSGRAFINGKRRAEKYPAVELLGVCLGDWLPLGPALRGPCPVRPVHTEGGVYELQLWDGLAAWPLATGGGALGRGREGKRDLGQQRSWIVLIPVCRGRGRSQVVEREHDRAPFSTLREHERPGSFR